MAVRALGLEDLFPRLNAATANGNGRAPLPELPDDDEPASEIPILPAEAIDGDYIGELTRALTDGTPIPPQFVRENIKAILGAVVNDQVALAAQTSMHTRSYHLLVSPNPEAGKGESWQRTGGESRGFLNSFLRDPSGAPGIALLDGGIFGSGEFMAKVLSEETNRCSLAYFDEMSGIFEKDKTTGSIIEKKLLELFDGDRIAQGSFKNKMHVATGIELSLVGNFTLPGFLTSFTGRGSAGSGFLLALHILVLRPDTARR